jgi:hypothetical protein
VVALQVHAMTRHRCRVPYCRRPATVARPRGWPRGVPVLREVANPYRLCRTHLSYVGAGLLRIVGLPDAARFYDSQGRPMDPRRP